MNFSALIAEKKRKKSLTITLLYLTKPLVSIVIVKSDKTPISDILAYHSTNRGEANWVFFFNRLSKPLCNSRLTFKSFALLQTLSNSVKQSNCESRNSVVSFHANVADGGWHIKPWIYDIFFHLSILVKQERDKKGFAEVFHLIDQKSSAGYY